MTIIEKIAARVWEKIAIIVQAGKKFKVMNRAKTRCLGTHSDKAGALEQERAIAYYKRVH